MKHEDEQIEVSIREARELIEADLSPAIQAIREALIEVDFAPVMQTIREVQDTIRSLTESSLNFRQSLLDKELTRLTESVIKPLNFDFAPEMDFENSIASWVFDIQKSLINNLRVEDNGKFETLGETYSKEDIKVIMQEVIKESGITDTLISIQDLLSRLLHVLLKKGNGVMAAIILGLVINLISSQLVDPLFEHVKNTMLNTTSPKEAVKKINKETTRSMGVDATFLKGYRFVSTDTLLVHERATRQSKRISELKLGQVVLILRERKDWVLVEWKFNEEVSGRGWVYSRYLKPFK
jgi:hypothetical protein